MKTKSPRLISQREVGRYAKLLAEKSQRFFVSEKLTPKRIITAAPQNSPLKITGRPKRFHNGGNTDGLI
jgi:hypothetical protein